MNGQYPGSQAQGATAQQQMPNQYRMSLFEALASCVKKCLDYRGRASRAEFWWYFLLENIVNIILTPLRLDIIVDLVVCLFLAVPHLAVAARRLHDTGHSGWWQLLPLLAWFGYYYTGWGPLGVLAAVIGGLMMVGWFCSKSQPYANKYGDVPCVRR